MLTTIRAPILLLTLLFAALVGVIRAQPYDDSELRAFLAPPEGCPMPCFMGIRPGVTTMDGALSVLRTHAWVAEVTFSASEVIHWTWNGQQPAGVVHSSEGGFITLAENNIVGVIALRTAIRFGDVWLTLGKPPLTIARLEVDGILYERGTGCIGYAPFYWETTTLITVLDTARYPASILPRRSGCAS